MKPSTKTTFSRKPQGQTEQFGVVELQKVTDLCFYAFVLDIRLEVFPNELELLFSDEVRERVVREVADTTRMVSFVSYHGNHMLLDIVFSRGDRDVKMIRVRFDFCDMQLVFVAEPML